MKKYTKEQKVNQYSMPSFVDKPIEEEKVNLKFTHDINGKQLSRGRSKKYKQKTMKGGRLTQVKKGLSLQTKKRDILTDDKYLNRENIYQGTLKDERK